MLEPRLKNRKGNRKDRNGGADEKNSEIHAQSPIALFSPDAIHTILRRPLRFSSHWNSDGEAQISNNGLTAYLKFVNRNRLPSLSGGPLLQDYVFEQLHFHWSDDDHAGSEHSIDGKRYAAEAHLVYYNKKYENFGEAASKGDGLAVTGFMLRISEPENDNFSPLSSAITHIVSSKQMHSLHADCLRWMQGANQGEYFTYKGSLTTEPYYESVTWMVYKEPIDVSVGQIEAFRRMEIFVSGKQVRCNARDLQEQPERHRVHYIRTKEHMEKGSGAKSRPQKPNEDMYQKLGGMIYTNVHSYTF